MKRRISEILSASAGVLKQVAALTAAVFVFAAAFAAPSFAASSYDNLAVANVKNEPLNMRTSPSTDADIIGKCYRGSGGTVLDRKNGWTRIRSGGLEGWLKDDYLLFGRDIEPLAKELGLLRAKVTAVTLNVRKTPSTDAVIVKQAAQGESFPLLESSNGWIKVQLQADASGYISAEYAKIIPVPGAAVDTKKEAAALHSGAEAQAKPAYVISATDDEVYLLAACTAMETGNGSYDAQLAVASCIINRVKSKHWGKSISSVIYADGQFPGASSGLLDSFLAQGPSKTALKASKDALCGSNNIGDYLYFNSTKRISPEDYSSYKIVGGNCFYKK